MSKHTPGPWFTDPNKKTRVCKQFKGGKVVNETIAKTDYAWMTDDEKSANARLIAAAPELLNQLRKARERHKAYLDSLADSCRYPDGFMERDDAHAVAECEAELTAMDAAIAKATGEQA